MPEPNDELQLSDYLSLLKRRKFILLTVPLIVFGLVALYTFIQDEEYTSRSSVMIRTQDTDALFPGIRGGTQDLNSELQRATTGELQFTTARSYRDAVDSAAGRAVDVDVSIQQLEENDNRNFGNSGVLIFEATAAAPEDAQNGANTAADVYITSRIDQDRAEFEARQEVLRDRRADLQAERSDLTADADLLLERILASNNPQEIAELNETRQQNLAEISSPLAIIDQQLQVTAVELQDNADVIAFLDVPNSTVRVLRPAYLPENPVTPNIPRNLLLGAIAGIVVGLGVAVTRDVLDDRVGGEKLTTDELGPPLLATIPILRSSRSYPGGVVPYHLLDHGMTDAYRTLRNQLRILRQDRPITSVAITSETPGAGKTQTAVNFAWALSDLDERVLIIGGDVHEPSLAGRLDCEWEYGLADVLLGVVDVDRALASTRNRNVTMLSAGNLPENPSDLIVGKGFVRLLDDVSQQFDTVIIDLPPAIGLAATPVAAAAADAVVLVFDAQHAKRASIQQAIDVLNNARCNIIGLVANRSREVAKGYGNL